MRSAFVVGRRNRRTTTLYLLQLIRTPIAGTFTLTAVVSSN